MNRAQRRAFERQAKKNEGGALLAAQELSRQELDQALKNWGGLMGATNFETTRSVIVTNHRDQRVTIVARLEVFPAPEEADAEHVIILNPRASQEELRVLEEPLVSKGTPYTVLFDKEVPKLGGMTLRIEDLTPEQGAALRAAQEMKGEQRGND